jgi:glyceraldehyde 3-phosphate dehydrogenase
LRSFTWLGTARGHGIAQGTVEVDGDFLILPGKKIQTSRCRNPKEVEWGALGANYVCESTGIFLTIKTA